MKPNEEVAPVSFSVSCQTHRRNYNGTNTHDLHFTHYVSRFYYISGNLADSIAPGAQEEVNAFLYGLIDVRYFIEMLELTHLPPQISKICISCKVNNV